ncbi:MAG: dtd [Phycisphaerales bacterium]|nr:dtd [Phycisphaerales bacterium]
MTAVVQRVRSASVMISGEIVGRIDAGLCVLAAIEANDGDAELRWMAEKLAGLRVFPEGEKAYHLDVKQIGGALLLISNFTVAATTATGRRPGFDRAMKPELARPLFDHFIDFARATGVPIATGQFRAEMTVAIENDGPLTLVLQSPSRVGKDA